MGNNLVTDGGNVEVYFTRYKSYVAILTQDIIAYDTPISLVIGNTYQIDDYQAGDDFTNVGAESNENGTWFTATGTTPASWSNNSTLLTGYEPQAVVLNSSDTNYLGDIVWTRDAAGYFSGTLNGAFTFQKTFLPPMGSLLSLVANSSLYWADVNHVGIMTSDAANQSSDGWLFNTSIEIRVYQ